MTVAAAAAQMQCAQAAAAWSPLTHAPRRLVLNARRATFDSSSSSSSSSSGGSTSGTVSAALR
jgi:hypothetical protein